MQHSQHARHGARVAMLQEFHTEVPTRFLRANRFFLLRSTTSGYGDADEIEPTIGAMKISMVCGIGRGSDDGGDDRR